MALALSLSLDLFLMKGNLFIAVEAQPEADRQTDKGGIAIEQAERGGGEKNKEKRRAKQMDVVNVGSIRARGDMNRELSLYY